MLTESFMKMLNKVELRLSPCFTPISDLKQLLKLLEGLQNCLDKFANYCSKWGLSMNYKKTKIMDKEVNLLNVLFQLMITN
jgi:SNF2 family DNA or RNA helicase